MLNNGIAFFSAGGEAGWDVTNASYDSISYSVATQSGGSIDLSFKDDGSKFYIMDFSTQSVYQYTLSTPWDFATVVYNNKFFDASLQVSNPRSVAFKDDGTKMYIGDGSGDTIHQYSLSTAWDVSTGSYDTVTFNVTPQESNLFEIGFKDDGSKLYVIGAISEKVHQYTLPTPWVLTGATYDNVSFDVTNEETGSPYGFTFKVNGDKMYIIGSSKFVYQYSLSTPWVVSSTTYDNISFNVSSQITGASYIMRFKDDGTKMYVLASDNSIYQYSL